MRATFERRARMLEHAKAPRARVLAADYFGGRAAARELEQEAEELRDHGQSELALELLDGVRREAQRLGRERDPRLDAQLALCWTDLGDGARALALVDELDVGSDGALAARVERVRGRVAAQRHATAEALEHFERAAALDPDDGGEALLARVQLLHEARRDAELCALVDAAHDALARVQPRVASQIVSHQAMSLLRLGEIERARAMLEAQLADPAFAGDPDRDAGLRINLGTLERRAGDLPRAIAHFELAAAHCERAGVLTRVAQSRALFGGALRDAGELLRAEPLLASAVEIRERLGDQVGASAARGMYGMLLLERGRARPAIAELALAAKELRTAGRRTDAALLDAMRDEMLARVGQPSDTASTRGEAARHGEGDPRALLAFSRAHALRGDSDTAREMAQRAASLSKGLGLGLIHEEASFLERTLEPPRREAFESFAGGASRAAQDARLFTLLASPSLDEAALRALARELGELGRDDRSARAWIALAARAGHAIHREEAAREARRMLDACSAGLTADEARALSDALLSVPDPWPADLRAAFASASTEAEFEMEVLSLLEINHRLLSQQDLTGLLGVIVEQALAVSGAERGFLVLEENGELAFDTALDSRRGGIDAPDVEISHSVLRDALDRMQPVRISNAVDDPMLGAAPSVIALELRSILCVPFQVQPGLRGVIYADHRLREGAFDDRAERMLRLLADQAALAVLQVRRIEEIRRLNRRIHQQKANVESDLRTARTALQQAGIAEPAGGLVGNSPPMRAVHSLIQRAAQTRLAVLVCGPSGTGKELAARALHDLGPRAGGPFVSENCAAFPATLIEAELFGAQRGAFTGADRDREGLFERAHGGTLFLDEVGELPLELQAKLLRVLETSQVRRLGDSELRTVDFRLVAATNRDLAREVGEGRFRADLFYRLDGLRIEMPPLSTRTEDIPALVDHCLRVQAAPGEEPRRVSSAVLARLSRRAWPGNVRELFNEVARLCAITSGEVDDPELVRDAQLMPGPASAAGGVTGTLAEIERNAILRALEAAGGDKRVAAKALGISRAKIYQRLKEWGEASASESVGEG